MMATTTRSSMSVNPASFRNFNLSIVKNTPFVFIPPFIIQPAASHGNGDHKQSRSYIQPPNSHLLERRSKCVRKRQNLGMWHRKSRASLISQGRGVTSEAVVDFRLFQKSRLIKRLKVRQKTRWFVRSLTSFRRDYPSLRKTELIVNKICY